MDKHFLPAFLIIGIGLEVFAGEFNPAQVPANSQWYLHFDADRFKKSQLGKFILEQAGKEAEKVDALSLLAQFDPRKDLQGITLFGSVVENKLIGSVLVNGNYKKTQLTALLEASVTVKKERENGAEILSWVNEVEETQDNNQSFGSFVDKNHILLSNDRKVLLHAIKVLSKKAPALKGNSLRGLAAEKGNHYLSGLLHMKGITIPPEANFMENVITIGTTVGEYEKNLLVSMRMATTDEEACDQLQLIMQGFVALAHLSLISSKEPGTKEITEILQKINITKKNKTVLMNLSYPMEKILELIRLQISKEQ